MATILASNQIQFSVSMLAGILLAVATFTGSALLSQATAARSVGVGLAIILSGFLARLALVAVALFVCVRFLHLQVLPLAIGLAGGFTVLAFAAMVSDWRRHRMPVA